MQTHFDQLLQQVTQGLDSTATHYVDRHAQLVENAKAALDKAIAFAAGSRTKNAQVVVAGQAEEVKRATEQLAALQTQHKVWEQSFKEFRRMLKEATL